MKSLMRHVALVLVLTLSFSLVVSAAEIEATFSPRGQALEMILDMIKSVRKSIHVAAYSFPAVRWLRPLWKLTGEESRSVWYVIKNRTLPSTQQPRF